MDNPGANPVQPFAIAHPLVASRGVAVPSIATGVNLSLEDEAPVFHGCANLMRPRAIVNLMNVAGRRIKLFAPIFLDNFCHEDCRSDPNYIVIVAGMCVPQAAGARGERSTNMAIQACAVGYTNTDCCSAIEAKTRVSQGIKDSFNSFPRNLITDLQVNNTNPDWLSNQDLVPDDAMQYILEQLAIAEGQTAITMSVFTTALLGYCKQGNVTGNVVLKVTNAIRDELGINVNLDPNVMRSFWNCVGHWYLPEKAARFFSLWETAVGNASLRLKLLIQQASWTSMTNFVNIGKAKGLFPDFPWDRAAMLFPADFTAYTSAVRVVNGNPYYGYHMDLGAAKSTLYPNLSYLAYCLLMNIAGDRSLRDFQGTNRNTPFAAAIDGMVRAYETERQAEAANRAPGDADVEKATDFLALITPTGQ